MTLCCPLSVFWPFLTSKRLILVNFVVSAVSSCFNSSHKYEMLFSKPQMVIFLRENAPSHTENPVRGTLETLSWDVLSHAAYLPDLAPSDYHFFASMGHALPEQRSSSLEDIKNSSMNGLRQKGKMFTGVVFTNCQKDGKMYNKHVTYFEKTTFYHSTEFNVFF